jgi:excisionase family DNA binding protein
MAQQMEQERETQPTFLTPEQAAKRAGVNLWTVYRWLKSGRLPGSHAGEHGHWHILLSDLLDFLLSTYEDKPEDTSWNYAYAEVSTQPPEKALDESRQTFLRYASLKQHNISLQEQAGTFPPPPPQERWRVQFLLEVYTLYANTPEHQLTAGELKTALEKVRPE